MSALEQGRNIFIVPIRLRPQFDRAEKENPSQRLDVGWGFADGRERRFASAATGFESLIATAASIQEICGSFAKALDSQAP